MGCRHCKRRLYLLRHRAGPIYHEFYTADKYANLEPQGICYFGSSPCALTGFCCWLLPGPICVQLLQLLQDSGGVGSVVLLLQPDSGRLVSTVAERGPAAAAIILIVWGPERDSAQQATSPSWEACTGLGTWPPRHTCAAASPSSVLQINIRPPTPCLALIAASGTRTWPVCACPALLEVGDTRDKGPGLYRHWEKVFSHRTVRTGGREGGPR